MVVRSIATIMWVSADDEDDDDNKRICRINGCVVFYAPKMVDDDSVFILCL